MNNDSAAPTNVRGAAVLATAWICAGLAIILVATRFYVRSRILEKIRVNDWLILIVLGMALVTSSFCSVSVHWGLGQHAQYLTPKQFINASKWVIITNIFAIMGPNLGRISFALLLLDITPPWKRRRRLLWVLTTLQFVFDLSVIIMIFAQCTPVKGLWDHTIKAKCLDVHILYDISYFQGSFNASVDFVLAIFPAGLFWNMNLMKRSTKISLSVLMGLGIFSMGAAIAKLVHLNAFIETKDQTHKMAAFAICFTLEGYTVLFAASIPTLRPLVRRDRGSTDKSDDGGGKHYRLNLFPHSNRRHGHGKRSQTEMPSGPTNSYQWPQRPYRIQTGPEVDEEEILRSNIRKHTQMAVSYEPNVASLERL